MSGDNYIHDYSYELISPDNKMNYHLNALYLELCDIIDTITVFEIVNGEWTNYVKKYATVRTLLYEALPYRIYIGLSKIFTTRADEYSLKRAVNIISQLDAFKYSKTIQSLIKKLLTQCNQLTSLEAIRVYRDKLFGHMDKDTAFSDCRIDIGIPMEHINKAELIQVADTVAELYYACFGIHLAHDWEGVNKDIVIATFFNPILENNENVVSSFPLGDI